MRLRITIAMLEIRNRETLQSKVNICKSDVKIGDHADSLRTHDKFFVTFSKITKMTLLCLQNRKFVFAQICHNVNYTSQRKMSETVNNDAQYCLQHVKLV